MKSFGRVLWVVLAGVGALVAFKGLRRGFGHGRWQHGGRCGGGRCGGGRGRFVSWKVDRLLDRIDASQEQRQRVHALKDRILEGGRALREETKSARKEVIDLWSGAAPDAARLHGIVDERIDALRGFMHTVAEAALELHDTLTASQREMLTSRVRSC
jgi:Spy/CpxP family protein refolding chaperone